MMRCDECVHVDYRRAVAQGMRGWGLCKKARDLAQRHTYLGRSTVCDKGLFERAGDEAIERRQVWLARVAENKDKL